MVHLGYVRPTAEYYPA